jgi:ATP-binding cassette, subfamily B, bacterial
MLMVFFQENASMWKNLYIKSFGHGLASTARTCWTTVKLAWKAAPLLLVGVLLLFGVESGLTPLQLALSRAVIDRLAAPVGRTAALDPFVTHVPLAAWIALTLAVVALGQLVAPLTALEQSRASDRLTGYVTEQVLQAANRWQGLERFEDPGFADDLKRAREAANRSVDLVYFGAIVVLALLTALSLSITLGGLHPLVPLLLILATLPQMARAFAYDWFIGGHLYNSTPQTRRMQESLEMLLLPNPAKDVRLYGLFSFFRQRYETMFAQVIRPLAQERQRMIRPMWLAGTLTACACGGVYLYVIWLVAHGQLSVGALALYGGAATLLQAELLRLSSFTGLFPIHLGFLPSLLRVIEAPPDLQIAPHPRPVPEQIRQGIVFERVSFTYPGQTTPVLSDVSFRLLPGECVALVGHNGAGKSTIVKLLLRLYDPASGRILLDGVDLREYDLGELRRKMGAIFQDFGRYELTAGENIGLGRLEHLDDRELQREALVKAGGDSLLESLPRGLETLLGRELGERELSGGEWQKLALARAYLRDSQVLVLDEPTAALDVQSEYRIYTRFHELTQGRLTLLISHRFSTIRMADRVLYLADGRIQEEGSHHELMKRDGEYARLYRLQAAHYLDTEQEVDQ